MKKSLQLNNKFAKANRFSERKINKKIYNVMNFLSVMNGIDSAEHIFTSTGNFTVTFNGTAFPEPKVNHTETSVGEGTLGKFNFKKTPTA